MNYESMSLQQLICYKAAIEVYGTSSELYEVVNRIRELREHGDCSFSDDGKER